MFHDLADIEVTQFDLLDHTEPTDGPRWSEALRGGNRLRHDGNANSHNYVKGGRRFGPAFDDELMFGVPAGWRTS